MVMLRSELFDDLDTVEGLRTALQNAVRLEHATIPPYLYALFSLVPGTNVEIARLIHGVVGEEMAHMALAANVLNAIGGSPSVDDPSLLPTFPGPLPGGVDSDLCVHLEPFSIDVVRNTFMVIEHPDHPIEFPTALALEAEQLTIGAFYTRISHSIGKLGESIFTGDPARQMAHGFDFVEVIPVTDVASAQAAIEIIVEQGEGTSESPLDPDGARGDLAHYYRFAEIANGHELVPNPNAGPDTPPDERFSYTGPEIPFQTFGVLPLVKNPAAANYPVGSLARNLCDTFNYTYTSLLKALHIAFNGRPDTLPAALGLMFSLKEQFLEMAKIPPPPGINGAPLPAPSFEYLAVLPADGPPPADPS
jgi:rubrerythrin